MPFSITRNDIVNTECDAIVSPDDSALSMSGGTSLAIARAAGEGYVLLSRALAPVETGKAAVGPGGDLPASHVIHTVAPVYADGLRGEELLLRSCYRSCLELALEYGFESIAFPLLGSGTFGYPKDQALSIANEEIGCFLSEHDMDVMLVVFDTESFELSRDLISDISEYIDEHYVRARLEELGSSRNEPMAPASGRFPHHSIAKPRAKQKAQTEPEEYDCCLSFGVSREDIFPDECASEHFRTQEETKSPFELDEGFSDTLLRLIDEKGMSDSQCYRKANLDRKLFSKIRSNPAYHPSKPTAIALAMALELDMEDTEKLLKKAGYALSDSYLSDVIVSYFIKRGDYDLFRLNEVLFHYDQPLIGQ